MQTYKHVMHWNILLFSMSDDRSSCWPPPIDPKYSQVFLMPNEHEIIYTLYAIQTCIFFLMIIISHLLIRGKLR